MNLNNFQELIDDVILKRGKDYFKKGHVEKIEEIGSNHYIVGVEGSENYTVEIIIDDHKNIMETSCDCPYDFGEYCKHQVAAFFALENDVVSESKRAKRVKEKKVDLPTLISNFSKENFKVSLLILHRNIRRLKSDCFFNMLLVKMNWQKVKSLSKNIFVKQHLVVL
jgi:hypothetical protein